LPTAGLVVVHADGLSRKRPGREQEPRLERRPRQPVVPAHRLAMPHCVQALPALGGEQLAPRAHWAVVARYSSPPLRVAALRRSSLEIVDAARPRWRATSCMLRPCAPSRPISSRSINERFRLESDFADCKHLWWHAACLPEPSCSYRRRRTGLDSSNLTRLACRDRCPEPSLLVSSCHRWSAW